MSRVSVWVEKLLQIMCHIWQNFTGVNFVRANVREMNVKSFGAGALKLKLSVLMILFYDIWGLLSLCCRDGKVRNLVFC